MPQAVLRGAPNLWQKLSGNAPTHHIATVWKLIAYHPEHDGRREGDDPAQQSPSEPGHLVEGIQVAYDGHKTTCGATLVSSQVTFSAG